MAGNGHNDRYVIARVIIIGMPFLNNLTVFLRKCGHEKRVVALYLGMGAHQDKIIHVHISSFQATGIKLL